MGVLQKLQKVLHLENFTQRANLFIDKYRIIHRGLYLGLALNAYIAYTQIQKVTALRILDEHLDNQKADYMKKVEYEREQIEKQIESQLMAQENK
ncbi:hypothetical protein TTHERM_000047249 (macronuclear) [Tetrahymena thermophila SB210]|uniref:Uncharacterized protein n=1 Tax=Tetrahymena thermophila (strain SB210) TaxID=312017 RepID=W7XIG2_TETTS|nr:hypothetical protein TTHERM_000047249 [Tetrahymena thermophila SB210]EWS74616.1 hypothetical protein TTHERM_000047249 [Tetrahymena thermophila SB210]|eukprot:XP_012652838.1 hypothetical protein TTHERM_000047249 [Tetrahymena thermophila SB210]